MSDILISYSTTHKADALDVRGELRAAGLRVWMDDQSEVDSSLSAIGVPLGQQPWSVISAAIDQALLFLVLDTDGWRRSEHCRREYKYARAHGKRIAVFGIVRETAEPAPVASWPVGDLNDLIARFHDDIDVVRAHTRLVRACAEADDGRRPRASQRRALAADLRSVLAAPPKAGVDLYDQLEAFGKNMLESARRDRATRVSVAAVVLVILGVLTATALGARSAGIAAREDAVVSANQQASLRLAADAGVALTTDEQVALAAEALDAFETDAAVAASEQALARAQSLNRLRLGDSSHPAIGVSDDGRTLVLLAGDAFVPTVLQRVELDTGEASTHPVSDISFLSSMLVLAPDASFAVFGNRALTNLSLMSFDDGSIEALAVGEFAAFTIDGAGALWWVTPDGAINRIGDPEDAADSESIASTGAPATALTVDADGAAFDVLTSSGEAIRFELGPLGFVESNRVRVFDGELAGVSAATSDPLYAPDRILRCDGSVVAYRAGLSSTYAHGVVVRDRRAASSLLADVTRFLAPACIGDGSAWIDPLRGRSSEAPPGHWRPSILDSIGDVGTHSLAATRDGSTLVVARPFGYVDIIELSETALTFPAEDAFIVVPLPASELLVDADGEVRRRLEDGRSEVIDELGGQPSDLRPAIVGDLAVITTSGGLAALDSTGVIERTDVDDEIGVVRPDGVGGVVATTPSQLIVVPDAEQLRDHTAVSVEELQDREFLQDVAVDASQARAFVTTSFGRLLEIDLSEEKVTGSARVAPGLSNLAVALLRGPEGESRILTYGADGFLREHSPKLDTVNASLLPGVGRSLVVSPDETTILVGTVGGNLDLLDARSLLPIQEVSRDRPSNSSYQFASSTSLIGTNLVQVSEGAWDNEVEVIPLGR